MRDFFTVFTNAISDHILYTFTVVPRNDEAIDRGKRRRGEGGVGKLLEIDGTLTSQLISPSIGFQHWPLSFQHLQPLHCIGVYYTLQG